MLLLRGWGSAGNNRKTSGNFMTDVIELDGFLKKQAATDGIVGGVLNAGIHYLIIGPVLLLPVTNGWQIENPSLFGFLVPLVILLSFLQSYITFWVTVSKRRKGTVAPALEPDVEWKKIGVRMAAIHGAAAAAIILLLAIILGLTSPEMTIEVPMALGLIGVMAGTIAWICSSRAVAHTQFLDA
jgi:hypothetical protein